MSFTSQLECLYPHARQHCPAPVSHTPGCTLIFAVSDGTDRAFVRHGSASSFDEAWRIGSRRMQDCLKKNPTITAKHVRIDWVESSEPLSWNDFQKRIGSVKRTYFRCGFALDEAFKYLLTEAECNANALFYGGAEVLSGVFNAHNFNIYSKGRFGKQPEVPASPEQTLWLISTAGVYAGPDGQVQRLPGLLQGAASPLARGLYTGHREIPQLSAPFLKELLGASSCWLASQIHEDGRFTYGYFPCFGREIPTYNSLRHASSLYSLLDVMDVIDMPELLPAIECSLGYLSACLIKNYTAPDGTKMAFVVDDVAGEIKLGANGVALLAYAKYAELTGRTQYRDLARLLAEGIAFMQNPETGTFVHVLNSKDLSVKAPFRVIYYDGEAVFGLMRLYSQDKNPRFLEIAQKAFESFLTSAEHIKAHDHWLSYAANEISLHVPDERYFMFGARNCKPYLDFILSRETTYPTLLELMMAAQKLLVRADELEMTAVQNYMDMDTFKRALHYRAHYLLNGFFWPELAMFYKKPSVIKDAFFIRHHAFRCRIDDTQHYLSGLAAYSRMLQKNDAGWAAPENPRALGALYQP